MLLQHPVYWDLTQCYRSNFTLPWLIGFAVVHSSNARSVSVLYWLQPDILRQLSVHGLLPPILWEL